MRNAFAALVIVFSALLSPAWAANETAIVLEVRADRTEPVYKCNETAAFSLVARQGDKTVTEGEVAAVLSFDGGKTIAEKTVLLGPEPSIISGTIGDPGFLLCAVSMPGNKAVRTRHAAAAFEPERIQTMAALPDDFDAFWAEGRARVDAIPMDLQLTSIPEFSDDTQETFKISMANINDTRIYGFLSVPKGKEPPYPAFVSVPGAGVGVPGNPIKDQAAAGALSLIMGVHTHDLGLPGEEYQALREGALREYYLQGAPDRERYFYRRAILGIDRAVRYLMSRPDWDGKRLVYFGSSQGGAMGLILAGLNPEISAIAVNVPGLCDLNGARADRQPGFPLLVANVSEDEREQCMQMVEYFDGVNFARKIRCPVIMSVGFIDRTCSPSSVYAAFNVIQAPKRMFHGPESGHAFIPSFGEYFDSWMNGQLGRSDPLPPAAD